MRYPNRNIGSIKDLIDRLKVDYKPQYGPIWFRGHSKGNYSLLPSLYRKKTKVSEDTLINKFIQNATLLVNNNNKLEEEWLFIMQHHGVPTRLLDWSESPLVALYFACGTNVNVNGALYAMLPIELNKYAGIKPDEKNRIPAFNDSSIDSYKPSRFRSEDTSTMNPIAIICPRNTPRMQAQLGTFTIFHRKNDPLEIIGDKKHIWKYLIPARKKKEIQKELSLLSYDEFNLFPELSSLGNKLRRSM